MTQTQKIIADALGTPVAVGKRVYIKEEKGSVSFSDKLCGAYGKLFLAENIFEVPCGIFVDLCGALRNDATKEDVANYILQTLEKKDISQKSVEFGGDSMTYLTMEDRFAVVEKLMQSEKKPFCITFEYDYITAEYTLEKFGKKPQTFFNDGPASYEEIIALSLDKA